MIRAVVMLHKNPAILVAGQHPLFFYQRPFVRVGSNREVPIALYAKTGTGSVRLS